MLTLQSIEANSNLYAYYKHGVFESIEKNISFMDMNEKSSLSRRVIADIAKYIDTGFGVLYCMEREKNHPRNTQAYILYQWRCGFSLKILSIMKDQNDKESFLDEYFSQILTVNMNTLSGIKSMLVEKIAQELGIIEWKMFSIVNIGMLRMKSPLVGFIDTDEDGFITKCLEIPQVFGFGDTPDEAIENLYIEISTLYNELLLNDDFSEEFIALKQTLCEAIEK